MSVPRPAPSAVRRTGLRHPGLLRTLLLVLLTLSLALAAPAAGATVPVAPAATAEAESSACTGDGEVRLTSRRELPAPVPASGPRLPHPRLHRILAPPARPHEPPAPARTTVLRC
ncbi:hypothetical protein ACIBI4_31885 [Streptomyces sp. NPDC050418]|uniref:hypothetical protein n=1 Tax=Streptomyces sp. NPDC050418 TaxID=3365612 RepID=UPI0037A9A233